MKQILVSLFALWACMNLVATDELVADEPIEFAECLREASEHLAGKEVPSDVQQLVDMIKPALSGTLEDSYFNQPIQELVGKFEPQEFVAGCHKSESIISSASCRDSCRFKFANKKNFAMNLSRANLSAGRPQLEAYLVCRLNAELIFWLKRDNCLKIASKRLATKKVPEDVQRLVATMRDNFSGTLDFSLLDKIDPSLVYKFATEARPAGCYKVEVMIWDVYEKAPHLTGLAKFSGELEFSEELMKANKLVGRWPKKQVPLVEALIACRLNKKLTSIKQEIF